MSYKDTEKEREYQVAYRAAHKEEMREQMAAYYAANREKILAQKVAYRSTHKEEMRDRSRVYDAAHKEEKETRRATRRKENLAYAAAYHVAHKEYEAKYQAAYYAEHKPEANSRMAARRALIAGTMIGITISQMEQIAEIYRKAAEDSPIRCYLCNKLIPLGDREVDHIFPVIKGGPSTPSNLEIACRKCNRSKHDKHPNELGILI